MSSLISIGTRSSDTPRLSSLSVNVLLDAFYAVVVNLRR